MTHLRCVCAYVCSVPNPSNPAGAKQCGEREGEAPDRRGGVSRGCRQETRDTSADRYPQCSTRMRTLNCCFPACLSVRPRFPLRRDPLASRTPNHACTHTQAGIRLNGGLRCVTLTACSLRTRLTRLRSSSTPMRTPTQTPRVRRGHTYDDSISPSLPLSFSPSLPPSLPPCFACALSLSRARVSLSEGKSARASLALTLALCHTQKGPNGTAYKDISIPDKFSPSQTHFAPARAYTCVHARARTRPSSR
jgi:hypothetical protein